MSSSLKKSLFKGRVFCLHVAGETAKISETNRRGLNPGADTYKLCGAAPRTTTTLGVLRVNISSTEKCRPSPHQLAPHPQLPVNQVWRPAAAWCAETSPSSSAEMLLDAPPGQNSGDTQGYTSTPSIGSLVCINSHSPHPQLPCEYASFLVC